MTTPRVPLLRKQLIAAIDPRTTMVCLDCAGQIRSIGQPFDTIAGSFQQPPFHRWCRSVVIPYLPGATNQQRAVANAEIGRRPLEQRRKGPGGVGARIPPPPHAATLERRGALPPRDEGYLATYDRVVPPVDHVHKSVISRYLAASELDRRLRTGDLTPEDVALVRDIDAAVRAGQLAEQVTVFTALHHSIVSSIYVSDIVSDDSFMQVALDPAVAAEWGHPVALTLPVGINATGLDRESQLLLLARRHAWRLLALGVILVAVLL